MTKISKYFFYTLLSIIGGYLFYFIVVHLYFNRSASFEKHYEYLWIFKDSILPDIDPYFGLSSVNKRDIYNSFIYRNNKGKFYISFWEFKDLKEVELNSIVFSEKVDLSDVSFWSGVILNSNSEVQEVIIKYGFDFKNSLHVNTNQFSEIKKTISGRNYRGFLGLMDKISLSDNEGNHQIIFNYPSGKEPVLFFVYKGLYSFYIITVESDNIPFDEEIIEIFDLKQSLSNFYLD